MAVERSGMSSDKPNLDTLDELVSEKTVRVNGNFSGERNVCYVFYVWFDIVSTLAFEDEGMDDPTTCSKSSDFKELALGAN